MISRSARSSNSRSQQSLPTWLGLDLSLRSSGIALLRIESETAVSLLQFRNPKTESLDRPTRAEGLAENGVFYSSSREARVAYIARQVMSVWRGGKPMAVGIEDYAFSKFSNAATGLHELGGVVKHKLFRKDALFDTPKSTEVKLFATGSGKASKEDMIRVASEITGADIVSDDIADAIHAARWIAAKYAADGF